MKMLPYSRALILDNTHNYGIMKTETLFDFSPTNRNNGTGSLNITDPLEWIVTNGSFLKRSLSVTDLNIIPSSSREPKAKPLKDKSSTKKSKKTSKEKNMKANGKKNKHRQSKKVNKCVIKFLKKGERQGQEEYAKKRKRNRGTFKKMQKKYMMPIIIGMLAAKSILIPIALKALAFMSAKGLMLGFFSTVMASVISLKGMFNHPQEYHNRKDDSKTQVEIIQVPTKSDDHIYYDDEHYRRGDLVPFLAPNFEHVSNVLVPNESILYTNGQGVLNKKGKLGKNKI